MINIENIEEIVIDIDDTSEREIVCIANNDRGCMCVCGFNAPLLTVGQTYHLVDVEVHSWHTLLTLEEFPDKQFNSVYFSEVEK